MYTGRDAVGIGILGEYNCWPEAVHRQRGRCMYAVRAAAAHRPGLAVDPRPASIAACGYALSWSNIPGVFDSCRGPGSYRCLGVCLTYILRILTTCAYTNVHCPVCGPVVRSLAA